MKPMSILIADDHEVVRRGVRAVLEGQARWTICGEATTGLEVVTKAMELQPDIVILDISMPGLNGVEAARQIRRAVPASQVLVLTVHETELLMQDLLNAGVRGYVLKKDASTKLLDALDALSNRETFFTDRAQALVGDQESDTWAGPHIRTGVSLTEREREVLQLLAEGKSNKEIGATLQISTKTVETHRARIMRKLHLHSMSELVRYAIRNRMIEA